MNSNASLYWPLSTASWSDPYRKEYVSSYGDLYLVIDRVGYDLPYSHNQTIGTGQFHMTFSGPFLFYDTGSSDQYEWISAPIVNDTSQPNITNITKMLPNYLHVGLAFAAKAQPSHLQISLHFLLLVVFFNCFKLAIMITVLRTDRSTYLVTLGDAAASFLKHPDSYTEGKCMLGYEEILVSKGSVPLQAVSTDGEAKNLSLRCKGAWLPHRRRYFSSINRNGRITYTLL